MRLKKLEKKMGRDTIEKLCKEKNWKLPKKEEITEEYKEQSFWIDGYADSEGEQRPLFYNKGKIDTLNKNFMINVVIVREDRICENCGHICEEKQ